MLKFADFRRERKEVFMLQTAKGEKIKKRKIQGKIRIQRRIRKQVKKRRQMKNKKSIM